MIVHDAVESKDVVSSIIPINDINAYVLFDSGATFLFVFEEFAKRLDLPQEKLENPISIEVANKEIIPVNFIHRNCCAELRGFKLEVDLISICVGKFDVILRIDWLSSHEAVIDCKKKCVHLKTPNKSKVVFYCSKSPRQSCCLTMMQARRLLRKGCIGYLAHVVDTQRVEGELSQILIVREFADVFPYEIPGLPSVREVEFLIDLAPGTAPISKASCRMTPVEMKELMV